MPQNRQIRYKRPIGKGYIREDVSLAHALDMGIILEFNYGRKQKQGQVGGWKNDPRPKILLLYDDGSEYLEGLNTNYLSDYYLVKLKKLQIRFPGLDGEEFYDVLKRSALYALKKGYRKYMRKSVNKATKIVPKD